MSTTPGLMLGGVVINPSISRGETPASRTAAIAASANMRRIGILGSRVTGLAYAPMIATSSTTVGIERILLGADGFFEWTAIGNRRLIGFPRCACVRRVQRQIDELDELLGIAGAGRTLDGVELSGHLARARVSFAGGSRQSLREKSVPATIEIGSNGGDGRDRFRHQGPERRCFVVSA